MAEYAPAAITGLFASVQAAMPSAQMAGVIGDSAHTYGYHRGAYYVPSSDYSVQLAADQGSDGDAACGLDISWGNAADHYAASARLLAAGQSGDPRMAACREFYGSTDGWTVCGWDFAGGYPVTSDDTHLWHIHASLLRSFYADPAAMQDIASVITGASATPTPPSLRGRRMQLVKCPEFTLTPGAEPVFVTDLITARWVQTADDMNWTINLMQRMGYPASSWEILVANPLHAYASVIAGPLPPEVVVADLAAHGLGWIGEIAT